MRPKNTDHKLQLLESDPRCRYCECELTERTATLDHVKPRSRGGTNGKYNLTLSCKLCNTFKAAKTPMEVLALSIRLVAISGRI